MMTIKANNNLQGGTSMNKVKKLIKIKNNETIALEKHPVPVLGIDYKVKIVYKNIKVAELKVDNAIIKIELPNKYKNNNEYILDLAIDKMYEQIAKVEIERAMEKTRLLLGFAPEDYDIKNMKKEIARCMENKITINPKIVMFHRNIIDFIILHEYCHLKYKTHSKNFYRMIEKYEPNFEEYEKILKANLLQY